ncbi:hypothetical protein GCU67_11280 [Modestobacter muralis]|uniref:DUF3592 domain-containing protein n=1 Tax=Modestobacter muralis TaxID=1608614 RepID=A0A6P0H8D8_9ACTN|nr:hypothetical protein [Modestobacter muralis]NEK94747.1 hypothetical protein [Modestobacter muralis]NEN51635.1 hypothetical protein [Modestobacter muralis]
MTFLLQMAGALAIGLLIAWFRARRARRSRVELTDAGTTSVPARVSRDSGRARSGRVVLSGGRAVWTARRGGHQVDLGGAQLLSAGPAVGWNAEQDAVDLRLSLAGGGTATVHVDSDLAQLLTDVLPDTVPSGVSPAPLPAPTPPGRSWWAWVLIAAAALGIAYPAWSFTTGYSATATVVAGDRDLDDGLCPVVWEDRQQVLHTGEADCLDDATGDDDVPGTPLDVRVSGWPDGGDPSTPGLYVFIALLLGGPPLTVGAWRLLYLRNRRRQWLTATTPAGTLDPPPTGPVTPLPELTMRDVVTGHGEQPRAVLDRLAPYATRQVPTNGWSDTRRPHGARTAVPAIRFLTPLWIPLLLGGLVLVITWPQPYRWWVLQTQTTASVAGISTGEVVFEGAGPLPGELTVEFTGTDGALRRADVATSSELPAGRPVRVVYATDDPDRARLSGADDDLGRGALLGSLLMATSVLVAGWRVASLARWRAWVGRTRTATARPALGLLTADAAGEPLVLLMDPVVSPLRFVAVPLVQPLPADAAAALQGGGPVSAHGRLAAGEPVVLDVGAASALLPTGPAASVGPGELLHLLDAAHALAPEAEDAEVPDR